MSTENLPAIRSGLLPEVQEFQMFQTIARSAKASSLYGGDENKIFMVLLAARELGIPPMLALNGGLWNIQGKIEISARLMNSMIRRAGHTMKIESSRTECVITGKRSDTGEEHVEKFTLEMAERAGIAKGNVWQKYAEDMLYARCMSRLARRLFPDVIGCAYVEGEIREAKELPEASYEDITPPKPENAPQKEPIVQQNYQDTYVETGHEGMACAEQKSIDPKITQQQLDAILDKKKLADPEWLKNSWQYLNSKGIFDEADILQSMYTPLMNSLAINIEKNKVKT